MMVVCKRLKPSGKCGKGMCPLSCEAEGSLQVKNKQKTR